MTKIYDVVVLTDARWLQTDESDWYSIQLNQEDNLVVQALQAQGLRVARKAWDDVAMNWQQTHSVLFRTTWDYFERFAEFLSWLTAISQQTRLFNSAELVHWNLDKHYLAQLKQAGVNIVPTRYIEQNSAISLAQVLAEQAWEEVILKPAVSGSARHTYRFTPAQAPQYQVRFAELIQQECMMLQPLQRHILQSGEVSLMVIGGLYSHAIRKTPKAGDFRVQDDHGGQVHAHEASAEEIQFAEAAVRAVPFDVHYARVDMVRDNQEQLAIMELEMIEPELFFRFYPHAAKQLAQVLAQALR